MRPVCTVLILLSLPLALSGLARAQNLPAPEIKPARHFQFTPQPGTAWMLQGTLDGQVWKNMAGPFFAASRAVDHLMPAGPETSYRLNYIDPAATGPAPVAPAAGTLLMEHQGKDREIIFLDAAHGILRIDDSHARSFTASWTKTAADQAEVILTGADGSFTLLRLEYIAGGMGQWGMEDIPSPEAAALVKVPIDRGGFTAFPGHMLRGQEAMAVPGDLSGRRMMLNEAGVLSILEFTGSDNVVLRRRAAAPQAGTYSYDPETATGALLNLDLPGMNAGGFCLTLTTPTTGTINQMAAPGNSAPLHSGTFSLPEESPAPPVNPNCPPTGIAGRSYLFADSSPCTLTFYANGEGVQRKEVGGVTRVSHFRYNYSRTGGDKASVAISFPGAAGDLVDDYELEFKDDCTGSYKRSSYAGGTSAGQRSSSFGPAQPGNP